MKAIIKVCFEIESDNEESFGWFAETLKLFANTIPESMMKTLRLISVRIERIK